jgi:hypothetical protein
LTREDIARRCNLQVPDEFKAQYLDLLFKYQEAISIDKYDLGLARNYKHKIHLKNENPVYRKQFKIPEAHHNFIEQTLEEWLKLGVVRRSDSLYNSPIFCVPKKQGQGLRIVQDFRELNQNSHIDKYSMKEITECISDIGRANSRIFSTLDLTSGFWQMKLDEKSQPLTAFTIPGKGQFHWVTSPMGLLGCPASFQRLMEGVLRNLQNVIVYIDDLLIHSDNHERHLQILEKVLERLQQNQLKINLEKCIFGNKEVSYLGFTLTPEGIKPGKNKLKAIETAKAPADAKTIRSFVGLCNFFRTHIKNFAITAAPLFKLTRKDSGYKGGPLPEAAMNAFMSLRKQLISEPVMAFPRVDRQYALITDAATGTADTPGGLGAILTQVDKDGKFYAISFASRQLKDHEKNYSPFLLEAAAAVWGMDHFNEYLKGKKFILYTDHKPLEKLGHLHSKTMNRFQTALLEHDFVIQYKKGSDMPADYLSRLPVSTPESNKEAVIAAFDPFQTDLPDLQRKESYITNMFYLNKHHRWPDHLSKSEANYHADLMKRIFHDKDRLLWVRLTDYKYPRTALLLPKKYQKEALCEAHNSIFGGHDANLKTYMKISSSYYWPGLFKDVKMHVKTCLTCQQRKRITIKPTPLQPLPIPERPNWRIHADLFGPMLTADSNKKFVLCITDAFTKYAVVTSIQNKNAETVADAIFKEWFCKFGIPAQIHTDGGKEFVNKLSAEMMELMNVSHTRTSPAHPQCNSQVEVFNKTVKKYLASFVDDTALNWETFLPALALSYNTSYHSTIATTPFELLFGEKARLPSFPNEDIQRVHYGETSAAERFNLLQKLRKLAHENATASGQKTKEQYDKKAMPHPFKIGDKVLIANEFDTTKNPKLVPNWKGPGEIIDINDTNAKIKFKNKIKVLNVAKLKHFYENVEKSAENDSEAEDFNQHSEKALTDFNDIFNKAHSEGPITRAKAKLIKYKDAAQLALMLLKSETDTINSLCDPSDHCGCCESEETYLAESKTLPFQWRQLKLAENRCKQWRLKLMKREAEKINSTKEKCHSNVPERFREPLMRVAYKLLSRDEATFEELTPSEQKLWNSFETDQIYRLLTGEPDTVPEFRFNWYTVETTDGYWERPQSLPAPTRTVTRPPAQPPAPSTVQPAAVIVKPPRASTSARARLPSSTTSSNTSSRPSTTPSSPRPSTSGTAPKARYTSSTDTASTPRSNYSTTDTAPSRSPTPPVQTHPQPPAATTPNTVKATTPQGSGRLLRLRPDVNYRDLHLGRNLLLGRQQFLKRCRSTRKSVGKAVQQTVDKVRKVADEFPAISRHSSSSSTASSK